MTVELSSLKIGKTCYKKGFVILLKWLDENQAFDNKTTTLYATGALKQLMRVT